MWLITETAIFREWSDPDGSGLYTSVRPSNEYRTLTWLGTGLGWQLQELDGAVHAFDASGKWASSTDRNGNAKTAAYSGDQLTSVTFPDGTREDFGYDAGTGKLATITKLGVDGTTSRTWDYTWSGDDLVRIARPDGTALVYTYDASDHPGYLTRIELEAIGGTSERVVRAYEYDALGNVVRTWHGDTTALGDPGPDAVDLWSYSYDDPEEPTKTTATDPLGNDTVYHLDRDTVSDVVKVTRIEGSCPLDAPGHGTAATTTYTYDAFDRLVTLSQPWGGAGGGAAVTTTYAYDVQDHLIAVTDAEGNTTTEADPLNIFDPLGLKSRVCCSPIANGAPASHCFIESKRAVPQPQRLYTVPVLSRVASRMASDVVKRTTPSIREHLSAAAMTVGPGTRAVERMNA